MFRLTAPLKASRDLSREFVHAQTEFRGLSHLATEKFESISGWVVFLWSLYPKPVKAASMIV